MSQWLTSESVIIVAAARCDKNVSYFKYKAIVQTNNNNENMVGVKWSLKWFRKTQHEHDGEKKQHSGWGQSF